MNRKPKTPPPPSPEAEIARLEKMVRLRSAFIVELLGGLIAARFPEPKSAPHERQAMRDHLDALTIRAFNICDDETFLIFATALEAHHEAGRPVSFDLLNVVNYRRHRIESAAETASPTSPE